MISLYRPPDTDISLFDSKFSKFLQEISGKNNKKILIAADWNIDFLKSATDPKVDQFLNNMLSFGLLPTITVPTRIAERSATLLDNILINCPQEEYYARVIYDDISDHLPILININCSTPQSSVFANHLYKKYIYSERNF